MITTIVSAFLFWPLGFVFFQHQSGDPKVRVFESEHWVMADSSPLVFKVEEPSGHIVVEVRSNGKVAGYRFGCVDTQQGRLVVVKQLGGLKIDLTKEEPILYRETLSLVARTDCKLPTRLSIIAVEFEDGGGWRLTDRSKRGDIR